MFAADTATGGGATLAAAASQLAFGAAGGMAADLWKALDRSVAERWFATRRATDENHVVEQALRKAHLHALRKTLERFDEARRDDRDEARAAEADGFSRRLADFLDAEDTVARRLAFAKAPPDDLDAAVRTAALATLPEGYAKSLAARQAVDGQDDIRDAQRHARRLSEAAALAELRHRLLREGDDFPPLFRSAFTGEGFAQSWFDIFVRDAAATQKAGGAFAEAWQAEQVALIRSITEAHGETLARIEDKVDALPDAVVERLLARLDTRDSEAAHVDRRRIVALAKHIRDEVEDFEQAFAELERAVRIAVEVEREGRLGSNLGAFVDEVLRRVAERSALGDYDAAAAEAEGAFERWRRDEDERRQEAKAAGLKLLDAALKQDILRRDAVSAAGRIARVVELEQEDSEERFTALSAAQDEWHLSGRDSGLNFDLLVSVEIAKLAVKIASTRDMRGDALNKLGISLQDLGERENNSLRLEAALSAYRDAANEYGYTESPLKWAMTQNNIGTLLQYLGSGELNTLKLEEAIAAFRAALRKISRIRNPSAWADIQNNLGNVLYSLGERERRTARLKDSIVAFHSTLEMYTRENNPHKWAGTQNNLGNALRLIGQRENNTAKLNAAIKSYKLSLEEWTRDRFPLDWSMAQGNLATTFATIGERSANYFFFEEAAKHYRTALEERTRERAPFYWATTQSNLGNVLQALGAREAGTRRLEESIACYRAALEELTVEAAPRQCAAVNQNLRRAEALLAERRKG